MKRFQMISDDSVWMFPAEILLSTVEMRQFSDINLGYKYETCVFFTNNDSDVLERYQTLEEAIAGHKKYEEQYKLKENKDAKRFFSQ